MNIRSFIVILFFPLAIISQGQTVTVENFKHISNSFIKKILHLSNLDTDKNNAIVDFKTSQKGFVFKNSNGQEIPVDENEGILTLKVPDKTRFIMISHPEIGDYTWRVPIKALKKKNRYQADLIAQDLTKVYKNPNQWLTFTIGPANSVLTVDSSVYLIRDGHKELYLPVGTHKFKVESPYFETRQDSVLLTAENRSEVYVMLQPLPSLVEKLKKENSQISTPFFSDNRNLFQERTINRKSDELVFSSVKSGNDKDEILPEVHLIAEDSLTQIKINREYVGNREWTGKLSKGFYLITTEKDGLESLVQYLEINDTLPKEINLNIPTSSVGMVNVRCNVNGAEVFLNDKLAGQTPCIIKGLKVNEDITLLVRKDGYKSKSLIVRPKGNDIVDIDVNLKKSK